MSSQLAAAHGRPAAPRRLVGGPVRHQVPAVGDLHDRQRGRGRVQHQRVALSRLPLRVDPVGVGLSEHGHTSPGGASTRRRGPSPGASAAVREGAGVVVGGHAGRLVPLDGRRRRWRDGRPRPVARPRPAVPPPAPPPVERDEAPRVPAYDHTGAFSHCGGRAW